MTQDTRRYSALQRVCDAINHKEPDRVPYDLAGAVGTGINVDTYRRLRSFLGLPVDNGPIREQPQLALPSEDICRALDVDVRGYLFGGPSNWEDKTTEERDYWVIVNEWGVVRKKPKVGGHYFDMTNHPLKGASLDEVKAYRWPDAGDTGRIEGLKEKIATESRSNRAAYVNADAFGNGFLQTGNFLCGYEDFMCGLGLGEPRIEYILERILESKMGFWEMVLTHIGDMLPIVCELDDYGTQGGLMISPELYRKWIKPRHRRLFDFIKRKRPGIKVYFHSCGSVFHLIPDLIEAGIDILNPIQVSAANMDTAQLKRQFGKEIVFWGGGIDTQTVLPRGTTQQVRDEVRRRIDDLAPGGGFVFTPVHCVQSDVPIENFMTMWMTLHEYGVY